MNSEHFLAILQEQVIPICVAFSAYGIAHVANIFLGAGNAQEKGTFDKKKFLNGLLKGIYVMVGCVCAIMSVNMLVYLANLGFEIPDLEVTFNYFAVVATLGVATVVKLSDVLQKLLDFTGVTVRLNKEAYEKLEEVYENEE